MKINLSQIRINEISTNVGLLHAVLKSLGYNLSTNEVLQSKAGESTLKQVREFQKKLNIPQNESITVDNATASALIKEMVQQGFLGDDLPFYVSGKVKGLQNQKVANQKLMAFDVDLKGAAVFRTIKSIDEIINNGGFEFLNRSISNIQGKYSFTFHSFQYKTSERKFADVIVYAIEGNEIIGNSRLVNTEDYSEKGEVINLAVNITRNIDQRTEYDKLMQILIPFIKESGVLLGQLSLSIDQIAFAARELDAEESCIRIAAMAEELRTIRNQNEKVMEQRINELNHELLYGIGIQQIELTWISLFRKKNNQLLAAINKSMDKNIISEFNEKEITDFLEQLQLHIIQAALNYKGKEQSVTTGKVLSFALKDHQLRTSFLTLVRNHEGTPQQFWNEKLPKEPEFKNIPELINALQLTNQLTILSGNHQALVEELQVKQNINSLTQLLELSSSDWKYFISKTGVPDFIVGNDDNEKIERYINHIQKTLQAAFPTKIIAKMIEKGDLPLANEDATKAASNFLLKNPNFNFRTSKISEWHEQITREFPDNAEQVKKELCTIQRVFQVSASPDTMEVLMKEGLTSAYSIASIPFKSFVNTYNTKLGGKEVACTIHHRASILNKMSDLNAEKIVDTFNDPYPDDVISLRENENILAFL